MEAQLQQLAVNTGCSPRWVLGSHAKNQRPNFLAHRLSADDLPGSGEPSPIQAKTSPMPLHHSSWRDQNKRRSPSATRAVGEKPRKACAWWMIDGGAALRATLGAADEARDSPESDPHANPRR